MVKLLAIGTLVFLFFQQLLAGVQQPGKSSIEGVVLSTDKKPISGAQVTLMTLAVTIRPQGGPLTSIAPAITDANGRFVFTDLYAGTYRAIAAANGYARQEYKVALGGRTVLRQKSVGSNIRGRQNTIA